MKNRFSRIIVLGLTLGIILLLIQWIFNIDPNTMSKNYWKIGLLILLVIVVAYTAYFLIMTNKMKKNLRLYYDGKYKEFNEEMEKFLKKTKGKLVSNIIKINLSAGYQETKEYEKSKDVLESVDIENIRDEKLRVVYWMNLASSYFKLGEFKKFKDIYEKQENLFERNQYDPGYQESLAQLKVLNYVVDGKYREAKEYLNEIKAKFTKSKHSDSYDELAIIIDEEMEKNQSITR